MCDEVYNNVIYNGVNFQCLTDKININNDINTAFHNIDFSRYPLNNKREKHFYVAEYDNVIVDLENFLTVMEEVYDSLDRLI